MATDAIDADFALVKADPDSGIVAIERIDRQMAAMKELMQRHMVPSHTVDGKFQMGDFGTIPGTPKPTLFKSGAEKLMKLFALGAGQPELEDLGIAGPGTARVIHYRCQLPIVHLQSGTIVAVGIGESSSDEEKFHWRKPVSEDEWNDMADHDKRTKYGKGWTGKQVRIDPASIANNIAKIAKKRALIDGVLTATAASQLFTQDINDSDEREGNGEAARPEPPREKPKGKWEDPGKQHDKVITEPQRKRLFALLFKGSSGKEENNTRTEQLKSLLKDMGIDSTTEIPVSAYEEICEDAQRIARGE
jgi:hypothetical protein